MGGQLDRNEPKPGYPWLAAQCGALEQFNFLFVCLLVGTFCAQTTVRWSFATPLNEWGDDDDDDDEGPIVEGQIFL